MTTAQAHDALSPVLPPTLRGAPPRVRLSVEYWTVTMDGADSCGSCDETLTALQAALAQVRPVAQALGIDVDIVPRTVATWGEALEHVIVASPTIRAEGIELHPIHSGDTEARAWRWRGATSDTVPGQALTDLLVRALAARSRRLGVYLEQGGPAPYVRRYLQADPAAVMPVASGSGCGPSACS